jgi:hypothetical protein
MEEWWSLEAHSEGQCTESFAWTIVRSWGLATYYGYPRT